MSVISIREMPGSPKGKKGGGKADFTRSFYVECDSLFDGPATVWTGFHSLTGIVEGTPYVFGSEGWGTAIAKEFDVPNRIGDNQAVWQLNVNYESSTNENEDPDPGQYENPLLIPADIDVDYEGVEVPVTTAYDETGEIVKGFVSSAGEPLKEIQTDERFRQIINITRNESIASPILQIGVQYANKLNSDEFWGFAAGLCLCRPVKIKRQFHDHEGIKTPYLNVQYQIVIDEEGWALNPLDYGTYYLHPFDPTLKLKYTTEDGHPAETRLNGMGEPLPDANEDVFLGPFHHKKRLPFAALNLPQSWTE